MCLIIRTQKLKSFYAAAPPALLCRKEQRDREFKRFIAVDFAARFDFGVLAASDK